VLRSAAESCQKAGQGKDVLLMEMPGELGYSAGDGGLLRDVIDAVGAGVVVVLQYGEGLLKGALGGMGEGVRGKALGAVVNAVPGDRMARVEAMKPGLDLPVFGVLPLDRALMGISVDDLREGLGAEMVVTAPETSALVENVMVGANTLDSGLLYFGRKPNKAVVVRGERPDMQLAALETSTRCLILTGGIAPIDAVVRQADEKKVPLMVVDGDTHHTLSRLESIMQRPAFPRQDGLRRLDGLMAGLDFKALYQAMGL
jgi:hypothetical protein